MLHMHAYHSILTRSKEPTAHCHHGHGGRWQEGRRSCTSHRKNTMAASCSHGVKPRRKMQGLLWPLHPGTKETKGNTNRKRRPSRFGRRREEEWSPELQKTRRNKLPAMICPLAAVAAKRGVPEQAWWSPIRSRSKLPAAISPTVRSGGSCKWRFSEQEGGAVVAAGGLAGTGAVNRRRSQGRRRPRC